MISFPYFYPFTSMVLDWEVVYLLSFVSILMDNSDEYFDLAWLRVRLFHSIWVCYKLYYCIVIEIIIHKGFCN